MASVNLLANLCVLLQNLGGTGEKVYLLDTVLLRCKEFV